MVTLSDENRRLSEDVQALVDERRQLASQVQEYVAEVRRVEEVLAQKVICVHAVPWLCEYVYIVLC